MTISGLGQSNWGDYTSKYCVDGNNKTAIGDPKSVCHTSNGDKAWWKVSLAEKSTVAQVAAWVEPFTQSVKYRHNFLPIPTRLTRVPDLEKYCAVYLYVEIAWILFEVSSRDLLTRNRA